MKKTTVFFIFIFFIFSFMLFSQQQKDSQGKIPEIVEKEFESLSKGVENNLFSIQHLKDYFWALQTSVYVNVSFKAELLKDVERIKSKIKVKYDEAVSKKKKIIEERNKKIKDEEKKLKWEPPKFEDVIPKTFHGLYLRVFKDGKLVQHYKAPVPYDKEPENFYSFGLILEPGNYELHLIIADIVYKEKAASKIIKLEVPDVTFKALIKRRGKLSTTEPVFYKKVLQLLEENKQFTVDKNSYQIGPARLVFYPYLKNEFKVEDKPTLAFFIYGTSPVLVRGSNQPQWNIEAKIKIKNDKGKDVLKFKPITLKNFYFYQQISFSTEKKKLEKGQYKLIIELLDKNNRRKGKLEIPFSIME